MIQCAVQFCKILMFDVGNLGVKFEFEVELCSSKFYILIVLPHCNVTSRLGTAFPVYENGH